MPSFTASDALEPLDYDFRPHFDAHGTVPEPTDDQVAQFYADLATQFERHLSADQLEGVDLTDPYDVARLARSLTADDNRKLYDGLLDLHAAVCGGEPSREAIDALPFRLKRHWYGMVQGWLRPESSSLATND